MKRKCNHETKGAVVKNQLTTGLVYKANDVPGHLVIRHDTMFKLNEGEIFFIGLVLEGFFYGLYTGIFVMYLQYHRSSKKDTDKKRSIVFYSLCALYVLSTALLAADIAHSISESLNQPIVSALHISYIQMISFGCCDFIAQFILIYRCWIVWGCNIRVVIIPSILAFAFLVVWLAGTSSLRIASGQVDSTTWGNSMALSSVAMSLTINALVTGLIVFRIFKVFREVRATDEQIPGATASGSKLWHVMFIVIESGMALFSIQLARLVVSVVGIETEAFGIALTIVVVTHEMLTSITPTIILVRTSMGLSFHEEKSMEEVVIGSLRFQVASSNHSSSVQEMGSINVSGQDNRDDDIGVERSNDISGVE